MKGSFRRALVLTALMTLAAVAAMAVLLAVGLARADDLVEAVQRSQDQLAQVTRIQGDVDRLRAEVTLGQVTDRRLSSVDAGLRAYRASVVTEGRELGAKAGPAQALELANANRMIAMFDALQATPAQGDQGRFDALAARVVLKERAEARAATLAMGELRQVITLLAIAIPILLALVGGAGVWLMMAGFAGLEAEVRERTAAVEASREALAEVDRNRRLFFSKIGHELRTPATVIRGEAEVALRDPAATPERLRDALGHVEVHSQVLQRRLEDMLALARAEDGRVTLRREPVDIAQVVRQAAALAEPYVRASGLMLDAEAVTPGPTLEGDASWLQQALLALIDNAAKFADDRAPIRISLAREPMLARIRVADSGPGVEACDLPHLFDSYYQTASGRARGGSGLGLSVARWVVEQHGGEIRAQSAPDTGLIVEIELPVRA